MTDSDRAGLPSNRGRWGSEDELGTLNLITDEVRARAAAEVRLGRHVTLARAVEPAAMVGGPFAPAPVASPVRQAMLYTGTPPMGMAELLIITPHDPALTHLDAVAHLPVDGQVYPGRPLTDAVTAAGVDRGSSTAFADGIVTRGVLLDLAPGDRLASGHRIAAEDLDTAEARGGIRLEPGDGMILRSGWTFSWDAEEPAAGLTVEAIAWMQQRDVAVYGGDISDTFPPFGPTLPLPLPLHMVGLARLGMPLIDGVEVDPLAEVCAELDRYSFLLSIAPPRLRGATGLPVNPLAIF